MIHTPIDAPALPGAVSAFEKASNIIVGALTMAGYTDFDVLDVSTGGSRVSFTTPDGYRLYVDTQAR